MQTSMQAPAQPRNGAPVTWQDPRFAALAPPPPRLPELVLWGAHGGAGTSTLAALLQPAWDMGAMCNRPDPRHAPVSPAGRPLLLTCRNTPWSAMRATGAVSAITVPGGWVAALVIVSDGWPEPESATARFRLLDARVGAVVRMPFVPALRLGDDPARAVLSRGARHALDQIRTLAGQPGSVR
jgi:hypothetical protein